MINEFAAIFIIIILVAVIFSKKWRSEYVKTAYGLAVLPGSYILSYFFCFVLSRCSSLRLKVAQSFPSLAVASKTIMICGIVVGLMASCITLGVIMSKIRKKNLRLKYILINGFFVSILTLIMVCNLPG